VRVSDLYAEPPERFIAARDALADELRASAPALARRIGRLRKPTLAVHALNVLARRQPSDLKRLVEEKARDRDLVARLVKEAAAVMKDAGHEPTAAQLRQVEQTLLAGPLASPEDRAALLDGRLAQPLALGDLDAMLALAARDLHSRAEGSPKEDRPEILRAVRDAAEQARANSERLIESAREARERARRALANAEAARLAAEASIEEAKAKERAFRAAHRRAS
jgi:hypothetical protein